MKKYYLLTLLLISIFTLGGIAQTKPTLVNPSTHIHDDHNHAHDQEECIQSSVMDELLANDPLYKLGRENAEAHTRNFLENYDHNSGARNTYIIPVVFHVIHEGEAEGQITNISEAQLQSAIDALNRDFAGTAEDGGIAQSNHPAAANNTNIQFCLASVDPQGNPTSGINRVNGTSVAGYANNGITTGNNGNELAVKALSNWDNRYYMNVWVVTQIEGNGANVPNVNNFWGGTLGFAYLPTNTITWISDRDGIVLLNLAVGNDPDGSKGFRLWQAGRTNRTLTHEVGHYLDLWHTFEGNSCSENNCSTGGDLCCDTPPTTQQTNCGTPACGGTQQVENYMDYTGENCYEMFSNDQTARMIAALEGPRNALWNTNNCTPPNDWDAEITSIVNPNGASCEDTFDPIVVLTNNGASTLTAVEIQYDINGVGGQVFSWTGSLVSNQSVEVTLPTVTAPAGNNTFNATTISGTLNGNNTDEDMSNDAASSSFFMDEGTEVNLFFLADCWGDETEWTITDADGNVIDSGGPYTVQINPSGTEDNRNYCLADGCYTFTITDTFGDGLEGTADPQCDIDGNYEIIDGEGNVLVSMGNPNFGDEASHEFCIGDEDPQDPPVPSFTADQNSICEGDQVTYTDQSQAGITAWDWTFEGGTPATSSVQNPTVTYATPGTYNVTLEVTNAAGTESITETGYITVNAAPATPVITQNDNDLSVNLNQGETAEWFYNGNSVGTGATITATNSGDYTVVITNAAGCTSTATDNITVEATELPTPDFTSNVTEICLGESVNFSDLSYSNITSWNWTFEGGTPATSTAQNPTVTYNNQGTFNVTLEVTNSFGTESTTVNGYISVSGAANVTIDASSSEVCEGGQVTMTASGASGYTWDNGLGTGATKTVSPTSTTTYTVTADGGGGGGACDGSASITIQVIAAPTLTVTANPVTICEGQPTTLTASGADNYTWNQGLGAGASHVVSPTQTTFYNVTGTVGGGACSVSELISVTVNTLPNVTASASATEICEGGQVSLYGNGADSYSWTPTTGLATPTGASTVATPTTTTTYTVTGTNNCGTNTDQITVVVSPALQTPTISQNGDDLSVQVPTGTDVDWYLGGTLVGSGSTHTMTESGTYTVVTSNSAGCIASASGNYSIASIDSWAANHGLSIYPNPTNGQFEIKLSNLDEVVTIYMIDAVGRNILPSTVLAPGDELTHSVDITGYSTGLYFVVFETATNSFTKKVSLKK